MRRRVAAVALVLALPGLAVAGEVYGKITSAGAPVPEGTTVEAKCGAKAYPAVKTDKSGSYHLVLAESGKCTLSVGVKGQTASLEIVSYDEGAQVDVVLETKDGKLTARRK